MADELIDWSWETWLRRLARLVNPWLTGPDPLFGRGYYWSVRQSEFATDVLFHQVTKRGEAVIGTAIKFRETDLALLVA